MQPVSEGSLAVQHGGQHYKSMGIQPIQIGMANRYDPCIFSIIKYVSRHRTKHGREDLMKADHFIDLRIDTMIGEPPSAVEWISITDYLSSNKITGLDADIIAGAHFWALRIHPISNGEAAEVLHERIDRLIQTTYPD